MPHENMPFYGLALELPHHFLAEFAQTAAAVQYQEQAADPHFYACGIPPVADGALPGDWA